MGGPIAHGGRTTRPTNLESAVIPTLFKCAFDILDALDDMAGDGTLVDQAIAGMGDVGSLAACSHLKSSGRLLN
ncbi:hypothetical protein OG555_36955 [Kribbella sp. NBC_01484]|uniref:hypothetical protein n=1 Tax=Kribbella sp. NBC_01484 TaxID=2903579 RepID=UPI002E36C614|nr:hypothetical protein [Kribbella sp. NBC_01484]